MNKRYIYTLCLMLSIVLSLTSCLKGNDEEIDVSQYDDMAITSFTLSAVNKYTTITTSDSTKTVSKTTLNSGLPVFSIDQYKHQIFNNVPLAAECDLKHVLVTITTKRNGQVGIKSLISDSVFTYMYTDSIDFSQPREFRVYALNGSGFRAYQVTINQKSSTASEKQWVRVANEENAPKALYQDYTLQKGEAGTFQLSKDGGNTWFDELLGDGEDVSLLPTDGIAWVSFPYSASTNTDYELMAGSCEGNGTACTVWRKIVDKDAPKTASKWVNIPMEDSNGLYLPKMSTLSLVWYDSLLYAIGDDGNIYKSRDGGLTWKTTNDFTLPEDLGSYHIKAATDDERGELYLRDLDSGKLWHLTDMPAAK
ncbi:MAG: hypothetical protein IKI06_09615 [Prevotella sp.]|nr:hypothetical protein [Prevotella sp.]